MLSQAVSTGASLFAASALLLPGLASAASTGCEDLSAADLLVYLPGSTSYAQREASYWSASAPLSPSCIVQPRTTAEVSTAVKAIVNSNTSFAVRSGGHSQWAGGADIANGVTIDLALLNTTTYDATTEIASIQPGPRWRDAFADLAVDGRVTAGGRDADVGVAGFITGGGNSYYAGRLGFASDTVVNFEVVLADGSIVNANATCNADLWKALKGGSGNFGIVTRFDVETLPADNIWGGLRAFNRSHGDAVIESLINFTNDNENHPEEAFIINFTYNPSSFSEVVISSVITSTVGTVNATAFDESRAIPAIAEDVRTRTISDITETYVLPSGYYQVWFTHTFKANANIVKQAATLHDALVAELLTLLPASSFTTQCVFQPLPTYFADISVKKGGNVLGLDSVTENGLLWLTTAAVETAEQEAIIRTKLAKFASDLEAYAESVDGTLPWVYINYADSTQDPLATYGSKNTALLNSVSAKYDPTGAFQKLSPAGFKLSSA